MVTLFPNMFSENPHNENNLLVYSFKFLMSKSQNARETFNRKYFMIKKKLLIYFIFLSSVTILLCFCRMRSELKGIRKKQKGSGGERKRKKHRKSILICYCSFVEV